MGVPQLVGLKIQDAALLAKQRGFVLVELDRIEAPEWPIGVVAQQNPPANAILKQTSIVSVRVSKGPPPFKLPNLANTDPDTARATLESAGLHVVIAYEGNKGIDKGAVTRSVPPAESSVRSGDTITIVVSLGETVQVPDLHGMANVDLARDRLEALGLQLGTITEVDDPAGTVPPGAVLTQDQPAGKAVEVGTTVNVQISKKQGP